MSIIEELQAYFIEYTNLYAKYLNTTGIMLGKQGRYQEAEEFFRRAIQIAPRLSLPRMNLANCLMARYSFDKAEKNLLYEAEVNLIDALKLPNYKMNKENILYLLGNFYYNQGKFKEALKYYEDSRNVRGILYLDLQHQLAQCYVALGEWENAKSEISRSKDFVENNNSDDASDALNRTIRQISIYEKTPAFEYTPEPIEFTKISNEDLNEGIQTQISQLINFSEPNIFFVGAGISYPQPSNLPLAYKIVENIFNMMYKLDKDNICQIYDSNNPETIFNKISEDLREDKYFPFEPSFLALMKTIGHPVVTFVDTLQKGYPNLNHYMLAHAIKLGNLVITVNFDRQIEKAYNELFPEDELKILVTDDDFRADVEKGKIVEGKLAKIHGSLEDYNSVALSLNQILQSNENIFRHNRISDNTYKVDPTELLYLRSTLSTDKAYFLQEALRTAQFIFMGYSNSDTFDIYPFLESKETGWRGLRVEHADNKDEMLIPFDGSLNKGSLTTDTSKFSRYCLHKFGVEHTEIHQDKLDSDHWSKAFALWMKKLRLAKGDGLYWLGKLYSQQGLWQKAAPFYEKAAQEYMNKSTESWLVAKLNLSLAKSRTTTTTPSDDLLELKSFIENNYHPSYKSIYIGVLLNMVEQLMVKEDKTDWQQVESLIDEAFGYGIEEMSAAEQSYIFELKGDILFSKDDYQYAAAYHNKAYQLANSSGEADSIFYTLISLAKSMARLNYSDKALNLFDQAATLAKRLENKQLQRYVFQASQRYQKWGSLLYLETRDNILGRITETEKNNFIKDIDECDKLIFSYVEHKVKHESDDLFNQLQTKLTFLIGRYENPYVQSYLSFLRSNLKKYRYEFRVDREIVILPNGAEILNEIYELSPQIISENYDAPLSKIDFLLGKYKDLESVQKYLIYLRSNIYRRKGKSKEEIKELERYLMLYPEPDPIVEHNLGVAYSRLYDEYPKMAKEYLGRAEEHLLKAIDIIDGVYALAIYNLFFVYVKLRDRENAKRVKDKLVALGIPPSWIADLETYFRF